MAEQINVFLENKPGRLKAVTRVLSDHNLNLRAIVIQDRGDYGMLKLLADDPPRALAVLTEAGFAAARKEVLAVAIADEPGGFHRLAAGFLEQGINLLDAYAFIVRSGRDAVCCVEVEDAAAARAAAEAGGFRLLTDRELYEL